jgi:hypothetical protein
MLQFDAKDLQDRTVEAERIFVGPSGSRPSPISHQLAWVAALVVNSPRGCLKRL